jgi:hypothetical protein
LALLFNVLRARDFLNAQFEFEGFSLQVSPAPRLMRSGGSARMTLRLPGQHIVEDVLEAAETGSIPRAAFLAGASRLVFDLPGELEFISCRVEDFLKVAERDGILVSGATADDVGTLIEFPDRVLLVPDHGAAIAHRTALQSGRAAQLWATRLAVPGAPLRFTAVANHHDGQRLSRSALLHQDRLNIVLQSEANPFGIVAEDMVLSALGGSAFLRSHWPRTVSSLSAWDNRARLGRDDYVRTVREGFLYPYGHRAAKETISQRRIRSMGPSGSADLRKEPTTITIREPERRYAGRSMPLKTVLLHKVSGSAGEVEGRSLHQIDATVFDEAGTAANCTIKAAFITGDDLADAGLMERLALAFSSGVNRTIELGGRKLSVADDPQRRGGTELEIRQIDLRVIQADGGTLPFAPRMETATVRLPAIEQMRGAIGTGPAAASRVEHVIRHAPGYLQNGLVADDAKQVFAELIEAIDAIKLPAEKAGGIAALSFPKLDGLSNVLGPVADVQRLVNDEPLPDAAALVGEAKLLGVIELKKLIEAVAGELPPELLDAPEALIKKLDNDAGFVLTRPVMSSVRDGQRLETRFAWKPKIKDDLEDLPILKHRTFIAPEIEAPMELIVRGAIRLTLGGDTQPQLDVSGKLSNFALHLGGLVIVTFKSVRFDARDGRKMEFITDIDRINFEGDLKFAEELKEAALTMKSMGGARIEPRPDGISVRYGLALPSVSMGVATLENIAFAAMLSLPFVEGRPAVIGFSLSERSNPFTVSVAPFGGTGFFALQLRTDGHVLAEACIEFGGIFSINLLGIVKGGVYLLAGVYLMIQSDGPAAISAHLRLGGYVDVLGLVSVSIEFYLALEYHGGKLAGVARLTIGIRVLFFSETLTFEVRKSIAHLGATPRSRSDFGSIVDASQWRTYCQAFA